MIPVNHKQYTLNALHVLRDSFLDLQGMYSLVVDLSARRDSLQHDLLVTRRFGGTRHRDYHRCSGQLRSAQLSSCQLGKRFINDSSNVVGSFTPHGIPLKCGSFGRQYNSVKNLTSLPPAPTGSMIRLLQRSGAALELHNNRRDQFIEHVKPSRVDAQSRPIVTASGVDCRREKGPYEIDVANRQILSEGDSWVSLSESVGKWTGERIIAHVSVVTTADSRKVLRLQPPSDLPDHFLETEPHTHEVASVDDDVQLQYTDVSGTTVGSLDISAMVNDYCTYVLGLLAIINASRLV